MPGANRYYTYDQDTSELAPIVSYSISKPIVMRILSNTSLSKSIVEQVSMLFGMVLFTMLNYMGQRFFAFREK